MIKLIVNISVSIVKFMYTNFSNKSVNGDAKLY